MKKWMNAMFRCLVVFLLVIGLTACVPPATPTATNTSTVAPATPTAEATQPPPVQIPLPSDWAGAITHADGTQESIVVKFAEVGGKLNIEPLVKVYELQAIQQTAGVISFTVVVEQERQFVGTFDGTQIVGQVAGNGQTSTFSLLPLFPIATENLNDFLGTYQLASGEALLINLAPAYSSSGFYFFGQGLMLTHFGSGAIRALYPVAPDTFLVGSARALGAPFAAQLTFTRDAADKVVGLTWQTRDDPFQIWSATRQQFATEVVQFTSADGIALTGRLTLPPSPGPHPAIMLLHGSEPGTKDNFNAQQMSAFMASQGIAILTYDKRGAGDSGGRYSESASEANLSLIAQDASAGVEYLKTRPEISANNIGLIGFSQAGWVIPLAASQSSSVAYFIILSGPITSVGHENLYSSYTNNGQTVPNLSQEELMNKLASAPHTGFNSTPIIATLTQPGLWLWGDQDKSVPVPESAANLRTILAQDQFNFTYHLLPGADHNLQQTTQGLFNEIPYAPGFQPDYYPTLSQWLAEYVK